MLRRGPRKFHINSEDDISKFEGWLRKGPRYTEIKDHPLRPRSIMLLGQNEITGKRECVGIVISMSVTFSREEVSKIVLNWKGH